MLIKHAGVGEEIERMVDAAFKVRKALGPGLLESVYEVCLAHELRKAELKVATQVRLPIVRDGIEIETGLRLDMLVEDLVIIELKAVEVMISLNEAQSLTYLKLSGKRLLHSSTSTLHS